MRYLICFILLVGLAQAQITDSIAQSNGWIKVQSIKKNYFDDDTIKYINYNGTSLIEEKGKKLIIYVGFINRFGLEVERRSVVLSVTDLFDCKWNTFRSYKKTLILNKCKLIEIPY